MNERLLRFVLRRDFPKGRKPRCLFCGERFVADPQEPGDEMVADHLDNNAAHNAFSNRALVHQRCNQIKRTYGDYQILAFEKLAENLHYKSPLRDSPDERENENVRMGAAIRKIVKQWLTDNVPAGEKVKRADAAAACAYLCQELHNGLGSPETMKRHISVFTSGPAPWADVMIDGDRWIVAKSQGGDDDE